MNLRKLLEISKQAAVEAGNAILDIYQSANFEVETKKDSSPLTLADRKSHQVIMSFLSELGIPVLSEEGKTIPYEERKQWKQLWLVDPLDGTKEFIKKNGEFTVNIALVENGSPILGVIYVPITGELFYGDVRDSFAEKMVNERKNRLAIRKINLKMSHLKVVSSRSHVDENTQAFISKLEKPEVISKGSSLKFMMLCDGKADVYPRFAPTMEWDTAAAHAVVNAAGGKVYQEGKEKELIYNKRNLLNSYFLAINN